MMNTDALIGKRILVTGGRGFLGGHLLDVLRAHGCEQVTSPSRAEFDLTRREAIEQMFDVYRPEVVFHLAAFVGGIGLNQREPGRMLHDNLLMGLHLLDVARSRGVAKMIVVGTTCSYPKDAPLPFHENDLWNGYPEPVTAPYGIAKRIVQLQGQLYRQQNGLNSVFVIPPNLYGPRDKFDDGSSHVIPAIIKKVFKAFNHQDDHIVLWGDGTATREFLYVEDAAQMILRAALYCEDSEPINIGTGVETRISDVVSMITREVGYSGDIVWDANKPNGQQRRFLSLGRATSSQIVIPQTALADGIKSTVEWFRSIVLVRSI